MSTRSTSMSKMYPYTDCKTVFFIKACSKNTPHIIKIRLYAFKTFRAPLFNVVKTGRTRCIDMEEIQLHKD